LATEHKLLKAEDLNIDSEKDLQVDVKSGTVAIVPQAVTGNWTLWDNEEAGAGDARGATLSPYPPPYTLYLKVSGATTISVYLLPNPSLKLLMDSHTFAGAGELVWTINHQAYGIEVKTSAAVTITAEVRTATT